MAIRLTGINSGLDTDSIVEALLSAQKAKKTKVENKLTKSEWKQEIWKDMNTKLYSLYTKQLTKFKTQGSYLTKKVSSSDSNIATATATSAAANGSHTLEVRTLAAAQSVTGAQISATNTKATLTSLGMKEGDIIEITNGKGETKKLEVTAETTIADFTDACKSVGLNANFDTRQRRFFISSKESGLDSAFSIKTTNGDVAGTGAKLDALATSAGQRAIEKNLEKLKSASASDLQTLANGATTGNTELDDAYSFLKNAMGDSINDRVNAYVEAVNNSGDTEGTWNAFADSAKAAVNAEFVTNYVNATKTLMDRLKEASPEQLKALANGTTGVDVSSVQTAFDELSKRVEPNALCSSMNEYAATKEYVATYGTADSLQKLGLTSFDKNTVQGTDALGMSFVKAEDAVIILDGARLTDSSNNFTVNGLTLDLKNTTEVGKKITLNTTSDTDSVYNMVKDFVKTYNEILDELNKKYNADSARKYNPLTDEEKEAMSEDEVEKWENKIKDSLLRKDGTVNSIVTAMRQSLLTTTKVDGVSYTLSSFGICTSSDYTEKGKLHIMGDEDDPTYATETNKLKKALEENPDAVMKTLSEAGQSLYDALTKKMEKTSLSSALTFYNDKQIANDQKSYKKQIAEMEKKLLDMEDKYYKQFSAMEMAMAKLNSQSSALGSLMGGGMMQ